MLTNSPLIYDVAISFAGEDRELVETVNRLLKSAGAKTFYDSDYKGQLWGRNLAEELFRIYSQQAHYCLMIVSRHYVNKMWARHERRAAIARMIREDREYILPYILDETRLVDLEGLSPDMAYLTAKETGPLELADIMLRKLQDDDPINIINNQVLFAAWCTFVIKELSTTHDSYWTPATDYFFSLRDRFLTLRPHFRAEGILRVLDGGVIHLVKRGLIKVELDHGGRVLFLTQAGQQFVSDHKNEEIVDEFLNP